MRVTQRMRSGVFLVVVLLAAGLAATSGRAMAAGSGDSRRALIEIGLPKRQPAALDSIPHAWPGRAMLISAVATAVPIAIATRPGQHGDGPLMTACAVEILAPSLGHLYGRLAPRAVAGMAVRAVGFGMVAAGVATTSGEFDGGVVSILFGLTVEGVSAFADVVTVASDVERANQELVRTRVGVGLRPLPDGSAPALAVTVQF